ncbi:MAG TPA: GNAT family N-acetyltransferase [Lysobacter sp.]|nr:GNAT family N-acetyltransferase [Lysobacter sp.]
MEFERCGHVGTDLSEYVELFRACFPSAGKLADPAYLRWLYAENPTGPVIGFNAREGGRLVAHYVCVPVPLELDGKRVRALLSLNTATHPDFQGRGLFTRLAELTYRAGAEEGARLVYGVANANSTPGFVRKLGFALVAPLEARIGLGPLGRFDWERVGRARFRLAWPAEQLEWRLRNPAGPVRIQPLSDGSVGYVAATGRPLVHAWAQAPRPEMLHLFARSGSLPAVRVWLGLMPAGAGRFGLYPDLPRRLRPSPLNLIVRGLDAPLAVAGDEVFFNFLDFDAF